MKEEKRFIGRSGGSVVQVFYTFCNFFPVFSLGRGHDHTHGRGHDHTHRLEGNTSTCMYMPKTTHHSHPGSTSSLRMKDHMMEKQHAEAIAKTNTQNSSDFQAMSHDDPSPGTPRSLHQSSGFGGGSLFPVTPTRDSSMLRSTTAINPIAYALSSTPAVKNGVSASSSVNERESQLMAQLQVHMDINKELKRLLVAAVGSDLQHRLDQIAREKAVLVQDLDASVQQLTENSEDFDRVAIECDIWRSKFLASRVMIDELASWKAELSLRFKDSQRALQGLLKERGELCADLAECNAHLGSAVDCLRQFEVARSVRGGGNINPGVLSGRSGSGRKIGTVSPVQLSHNLTSVTSSQTRTTVLDIAHLNSSVAKCCSQLASVSVLNPVGNGGIGHWNDASANWDYLITEQTAAEKLASQVRVLGLGRALNKFVFVRDMWQKKNITRWTYFDCITAFVSLNFH